MSNYPIANQPESRRCENCGAPIMGRFSPCVVCHSLALEGSAAHGAQVSGLYGTRPGSQQKARAKLPARRFWHPSPDTLVYPYDSIDEAELAAQAKRRARGRIVVGASVLAVSSAVYLVSMHADDWREALSAGAAHDVSAQNGKPSVAVAAAPGDGTAGVQLRSGGGAQQEHRQQQPADVQQRVATVRPSTVTSINQPVASTSGQHQVASVLTDPARVAGAGPTSAEQKPHVDARPGVTAQQPTVVAQNVPTVRPAAATPSVALPAEQHQVASKSPDPARVAGAQPTSSDQNPHGVEARPTVTAQQQPAIVAQYAASIRPAPITPPAALPPEQHEVVSTSPGPARVATARSTNAEEKSQVDALPSVTAQQRPSAVVAQNVPSVAHSTITPPATLPSEHRQIVSAPTDPARAAAVQPTRTEEKSHVDARSSAAAQQQQPPAVVAQSAPTTVRPAPITTPAALPREQHQVASAAPDIKRFAAAEPFSAEQKPHVDARPSATVQQHQQPIITAQNLAPVRPAVTEPPVALGTPPSTIAAQNLAPVRPAVAKPPVALAATPSTIAAQNLTPVRPAVAKPPVALAAPQSTQRHIALATPDPARPTARQPISTEDKRRADAARYLREARASMTANNLSAAKSRVAAAIAAQPDNREARRLRATIHTLEQQRDALLSLARSCGDIGHLACTSRDAAIALQIDSSSTAARRLATRAMRESELRTEPQQPEAVSGPLPAMRYVSTHH